MKHEDSFGSLTESVQIEFLLKDTHTFKQLRIILAIIFLLAFQYHPRIQSCIFVLFSLAVI